MIEMQNQQEEQSQPKSDERPPFVDKLLDGKLNERLDSAIEFVSRLSQEEVLTCDTECLARIVSQFAIVPPILLSGLKQIDERIVELVDDSFDRKTGRTGHHIFIPIAGDAEWFEEICNQRSGGDDHPLAFLDKKRAWIYVNLTISPEDQEGTLGRRLDQRVRVIEEYADFIIVRLIAFNSKLAKRSQRNSIREETQY